MTAKDGGCGLKGLGHVIKTRRRRPLATCRRLRWRWRDRAFAGADHGEVGRFCLRMEVLGDRGTAVGVLGSMRAMGQVSISDGRK